MVSCCGFAKLRDLARMRRKGAFFVILALATLTFLTFSLHHQTATRTRPADSDTVFLDETKCPGSYPFEKRVTLAVTRAIVAYYPVKQPKPYFAQLKWFLRSLLHMMKTEPNAWRTDVILFVENVTTASLLQLGCSTETRQNASESFKCVLVPYVNIRNRRLSANLTEYDKDMKEQLNDYSYADSIVPIAEQSEAYSKYDLVIRSDLDVFFTPAFSNWVPPGCTFVTGHGAYSTKYNTAKLARIANVSGTSFNSTIWNIGSTWIGPASIVAKIAKRTIHWMIELSKKEFSPKMRNSSWWMKADLWPDWHYGVLLLYGGHLAVNEVTEGGKKYPFHKMDLDHRTSLTTNCTPNGPIHLHTYQNLNYFSKLVFGQGKYRLNDLPRVWNSTLCRDYAGFIAKDSQNMTSETLGRRLKHAKNKAVSDPQ